MSQQGRAALQKLAVAGAVILSHLAAARNRTVTKLEELVAEPPRPHACCLCGQPMVRTLGPEHRDKGGRIVRSGYLDWWECSAKPHSLVGVPVREAA